LSNNTGEFPELAQSAPGIAALGTKDLLKARATGIAKRIIDLYFSAKCSALRGLGIIDFSLPANHILRRTSSLTIRHYYESGLTTLLPIVTSAITCGVDMDRPVRVLDFACGAGRQLMQLLRLYPNVQAHACDIRADAIESLKRLYPKANLYTNSFDPPLRYVDGTFDLVYSVSIFSHLSESDARLWLRELRRVVKPGGILCLTFNSYTSLAISHRKGALLDISAEKLKEIGQSYVGIRNQADFEVYLAKEVALGWGHPGMLRPTGDMYYSLEGARSLMEECGLDVQAMLPGVIDRYQDLAVLRRARE
jgi:SAM-dependent methyltransferase